MLVATISGVYLKVHDGLAYVMSNRILAKLVLLNEDIQMQTAMFNPIY
ncbi:hypothetical protein [Filimonas effusa]|nr:hypothetical protein [Filimonas effusa]